MSHFHAVPHEATAGLTVSLGPESNYAWLPKLSLGVCRTGPDTRSAHTGRTWRLGSRRHTADEEEFAADNDSPTKRKHEGNFACKL